MCCAIYRLVCCVNGRCVVCFVTNRYVVCFAMCTDLCAVSLEGV